MKIEVTQCSMCTHYNTEQYCEVWEQYITNDAFYCACGVKADRKTEPTISKMEQVDESSGYNLSPVEGEPQTGEMMTEEEFDSMLARVLTGKDEPQTERSE